MSLEGKNRYLFSYSNLQLENKKFQFKDFEKTKSYNSTFKKNDFIGSSFRAAQFKYCTFIDCNFAETDFVGTNLRGSKFINCSFTNCLFQSMNCEKTGFKNCTYNSCYLAGNEVECFGYTNGIIFVDVKEFQVNIHPDLVKVIESLRDNAYIRNSHILHLKGNKINLITLFILCQEYTQEDLITLLPSILKFVDRDFYAISYLKKLLKKAKKCAIL